MAASKEEVLRSYRHLYRHGLHAIQYASPARYTLRDELRHAYRHGSPADFGPKKVENTIAFLISATKVRGLAHVILKNLLYVWWWQPITTRNWQR